MSAPASTRFGPRRRAATALAVAIALHGGLFLAANRLRERARPAGTRAVVELVALEAAEAVGRPAAAAAPVGSSMGPSPARRTREGVAGRGGGSRGVPSTGGGPGAEDAASAAGPGDAGPGEEAAPAGLKLALDWNGFERAFGERAAADREAYGAALRKKRDAASGFGRWHALALRALGANRSFGPFAEPLTGMEARRQAEGYLAALDRRIAPAFDAFLLSLAAPGEAMHARVQDGPLRYNPFYVPPPPGEGGSAPTALDLVARPALTEFALLGSGAVDEVRLTRSSGSSAFDASAVFTVFAGGPFPPPPPSLLSARERAYFEWGFDKDRRRNGPGRHLLVLSDGKREDLPEPPAP